MQAATTQTSTSHLPLFQPRWKYEGEAIAFPESKPPFLGDIAKHADFDAGKHLAYVPPKFIYDYRFQPHEFATLDRSKFCGLGMTEPFQLLSPEGVAVARKLVLDNKHNKCFKSELKGRQPFRLRGLGYVSPFIRDLNRSPELDSIVSSFAGESVVAHSMPSNYSHVNIGEPNSGLPVDRWHVDSVDFVLIVLLSDPENMEGGELQVVANHEPDEALRLLEQHNGSPPAQYIRSVKIPAAGWAVMMQGSKIAHHVTEVTKGPERISMVNSYMLRDIYKSEDRTKLGTFIGREPHITDMSMVEFGRHRAWRVHQLMNYIIQETKYGQHEESKDEMLKVMAVAKQELEQAMALIRGDVSDSFQYKFDETKHGEQQRAHM